MTKVNVFISFDYAHDQELRDRLFEQGRNPNSPYQMVDSSVEELFTESWKERIRQRIKYVDQVIFLCGKYTNLASGVALEFAITQQEGKPYFLLQGRENKAMRKPSFASETDKVYAWTWENVKSLIAGTR